MTLQAATRLGPYEIVSALGAGGMGEVYRARDTRLERDVAIKVLPASYSRDPDRLRRFEQEARAASQLNHPNIVTVHDFGTHHGSPYVVQELLEGETLRQRIESGSLGTRKATEYALAIAHGLAAAHEKGIVHRDLKPENIFITADGRVKILDFGLAKLLKNDVSESDTALTAAEQTLPGVVMGTVGYVSPEQVRAQAADARSDIFSFGAILFEMLTGRRAFKRETSAETMTAILKEEPPELATSGRNVPPALQRIVDHCLEKSPEHRFQSAKDLAFALTALPESGTTSRLLSVEAPERRRWVPWAAIAAVVVAAGLFATYLVMERPARMQRMHFAIPVENDAVNVGFSADGRMLALVERDDASGENMLYFQRLGAAGGATRLEETEGASYPFWSPDDASIGFFADGKLQKIAIAGGAPQVLATASRGRGGSWASRGVIVYSPDAGGPLWRVSADGTGAAPLTDKVYLQSETSHRWPHFLPDGEHFLFWSGSFESAANSKDGIYLSSLAVKEKKLVQQTESNAAYTNGHLYYLDDRKSLISVPFDPRRAKITGEQQVISDHVSYEPSVNYGTFAAGGDDTVVYSAGAGGIALSALVWCDRAGREVGRIGAPGVIANPSIAPDGNRVVTDIADLKTSNVDIWIEDLSHNAASRFTFDPPEEATGVWSRDGQTIAYRYNGADGAGIVTIKKASGLEAARALYTTRPQDDILPNSWTLDNKSILCTYEPAAGGSNLVLVDVASGKTTPFFAGKASETNGMISPDGKWVAYASNDSGEWEIYVTTFPGAQGKWQVSPAGGTEPRWRGDGEEIFYVDPKGMLTAVPLNVGETISAGAASPLFQLHGRAPISNTDLYTYDVARDGKRFLVNRYVNPDHVEPLTVVLNATAGAQK